MTKRTAGINTYGFIWESSLLSSLSVLAAKGFRSFEPVINPPHLGLDPDSNEIAQLTSFMRSEGLSLTSLNLPSLDTNLASPFPDTRRYTVMMFKKAIKLASALGSPYLITVPGRMNPLLPPTRSNRFEWVHETIGELIPFARDHGVGLAIENVPFAAFPDAASLAQFLDDMGRPKELSICYDVANAHFIGESLTQGFETLAADITVVHCSDTSRKLWRHDPIGQGDLPFDEVGRAMDAMNYEGPVLLEIINAPDQLLSSIQTSHIALQESGVVHTTKD